MWFGCQINKTCNQEILLSPIFHNPAVFCKYKRQASNSSDSPPPLRSQKKYCVYLRFSVRLLSLFCWILRSVLRVESDNNNNPPAFFRWRECTCVCMIISGHLNACQPGQRHDQSVDPHTCPPCSPGYHQDAANHHINDCNPCGRGTYSEEGASSCSQCPAGGFQMKLGVFTLVTRGWAASEFLTRASKFNMRPNGEC